MTIMYNNSLNEYNENQLNSSAIPDQQQLAVGAQQQQQQLTQEDEKEVAVGAPLPTAVYHHDLHSPAQNTTTASLNQRSGEPNFGIVNGLARNNNSKKQQQAVVQQQKSHNVSSSNDYLPQNTDTPVIANAHSSISNAATLSLSSNNHSSSSPFNHYYGSTTQHSSSPLASLTERRLKNARQHIVPPNNHSPKPVAFSEQQPSAFVSHNKEAMSYNDPQHQRQQPYRGMNNHDNHFGSISTHHDDGRNQSFFTNGYSSTMPGNHSTNVWATPHPQQSAQSVLSSVSNEVESSFANESQTSSGLLSAFGSSTSVSAATAVANIASLIQGSTSSMTSSNDIQSPAISGSTSQRPAMYGHKGTLVSGQLNSTFVGANDYSDKDISLPVDNGIINTRSHQTLMHDRVLLLQRELEKERAIRSHLQQRVIDLSQQVHTQSLVEKSYEDVVQKYKMVVGQLQHMSVAIERYKAMSQQLEQERQMLMAENSALKAQKCTAVSDKTMKYNMLVERSKKLEEENSGLVLENETYQRQYEKCVDEISKQVLQALRTQKALQEQCMQLQDRLVDMERENSEYYEAAVRQARQASSDSRLGWTYRRGRTHAASPSADSVRSMPAQHLYWRQSSISSLEQQQQHSEPPATDKPAERVSQSPDVKTSSTAANPPVVHSVSIETEFPANNGSPKSTRRNLDRHPSSGSLDSAYHSRAFVKCNGKDVRCQRSVSAEALRDVKVNMRVKTNLTLPKSSTMSAMSAVDPSNIHITHAEVHKDLSPESSVADDDNRVIDDPFADDADNILSKHQSLIVGSMEDIFAAAGAGVRDFVIQEEDSGSNSAMSTQERGRANGVPTPPRRPRSRCLSDSSNIINSKSSQPVDVGEDDPTDGGPPPLPPKQYKGSRRKFKPLPAEPPESQDEGDDSSGKNTDSDSIKQELNVLTSQIASLASRSAYHN